MGSSTLRRPTSYPLHKLHARHTPPKLMAPRTDRIVYISRLLYILDILNRRKFRSVQFSMSKQHRDAAHRVAAALLRRRVDMLGGRPARGQVAVNLLPSVFKPLAVLYVRIASVGHEEDGKMK